MIILGLEDLIQWDRVSHSCARPFIELNSLLLFFIYLKDNLKRFENQIHAHTWTPQVSIHIYKEKDGFAKHYYHSLVYKIRDRKLWKIIILYICIYLSILVLSSKILVYQIQ